jgi:hypothetical protein
MAASRELPSGCRLEELPVIAVPKRLQGGSAEGQKLKLRKLKR